MLRPACERACEGGMTERVSVVMSVFNGERFVATAIESILGQSLTDFELVVVDDGSADATPSILAQLAARDSRMTVHRHKNVGLAASLNRGIALARAPLIARLDADDVAATSRLERQVEFLEQHDRVGLVGGAAVFVDETGRAFAETQYPTSDRETREAFRHSTPFIHSAATFRRNAFEATGGYRSAFAHAEDLDLWLRIAEAHEILNLPEQVVSYRVHDGQATYRNLERQAISAVAARAASRARTAGRADPFQDVGEIDRELLAAAGVTEAQIAAEFVSLTAWLARTHARAGHDEAANGLFSVALDRAHAQGTEALVEEVFRQRARVARPGRRSLRSTIGSIRSRFGQRQ
jgi:glycosyltransferase involved in cell wall biosynthesis